MKDPFQVLGISPDAPEEEIKSAYRRLAKQYHPDLHPGDKHAEEKMKEVNEAYTEAIRVHKNGGYRKENYGEHAQTGYGGAGYGGTGYGNPWGSAGGPQAQWDPFGFWGYQTGQQSQRQTYTYQAQAGRYDDPELQAASDRIVSGRYQDALNILSRMTAHDAAWHYLNALANQGLGNRIAALNHSRQAVQLDPGNREYRELLSMLQGAGRSYQRAGGTGGIGDMLCSNPCMSLCAVNMLLNCLCGGRYIMCC